MGRRKGDSELRPKRVGAGQGGAAEQLEKCANAITRIPKRPRNNSIQVPSSEEVNPMAPRTPPRKRRQVVKKQPNRNDASTHSRAPAAVDSIKVSTKYSAKPTFQVANSTSRFGFLSRGNIPRSSSPDGNRRPDWKSLDDYETMYMDEQQLEEWKNTMKASGVIRSSESSDSEPESQDERSVDKENDGDESEHTDNEEGSGKVSEYFDSKKSGDEGGHPGPNDGCDLHVDGDDESDRHSDAKGGDDTRNEMDTGDDGRRGSESNSDSGTSKSNPRLNRARKKEARHHSSRTHLAPPVAHPRGSRVRGQQDERKLPKDARRHGAQRERPGSRSRRRDERRRGRRELEQEESAEEYDILTRHHKRNRAPRPPSQQHLERLRSRRHDAVHEVNDSSSTESASEAPPSRTKAAEKRGFWPGAWKRLIDTAKIEFRLHLSVADAFPGIIRAKEYIIAGIVREIIKNFKRDHMILEEKMFPRYEQELYTLIYNDASTFRCEIKKLCFRDVVSLYKLQPPSNLRPDEALNWVKSRASELIKGSQFLRGPRDAQGVELNFAHKALFHLCVSAYYGTSQKLLGQTEPFKDKIPEAAVVLIAVGIKTALRCLEKYGKIPKDTTGHIEHHEYEKYYALLGEVVKNKVGGRLLLQQLQKWKTRASRGINLASHSIPGDDEYALAAMG